MDVDLTPAQPLSELPVEPREYHSFYRTPRFRWWHSAVALGAFIIVWGAAVLATTIAVVLYEMLAGGATLEEMAQGLLTPGLFLANNLGIALAIPVALAVHRAVFGQRAGWLCSIQGRFRWRLLRRFLLVAAVVHLAALASWLAANGAPDSLRVRPETPFLLVVVLLTTPLQAAGEEFAFRGLAARAVGSWFYSPAVGLVVATAVTAVLFMLVHRAGDLRLNALYLCLALTASNSHLAWRGARGGDCATRGIQPHHHAVLALPRPGGILRSGAGNRRPAGAGTGGRRDPDSRGIALADPTDGHPCPHSPSRAGPIAR